MIPNDWSSYEKEVHKMMSRHKTPGASVGLALHGKPIYTQGFGFGDVEQQTSIDKDTIFGIGSVTKSITAVAIMQLQERGLLKVGDRVTKYLPEFKVGSEGVEEGMTIHHFLTHTAGLPPLPTLTHSLVRSFWEDESMMEGEQAEKLRALEPIDTDEQLIKYIADSDVRLLGNPGEHFSYSNDCYAMLGTVVSRVSGMPYEEYVDQHILKPLDMTRSFFAAEKISALHNVATLYSSKKVKRKNEVYATPIWWSAPAQTAAGFLKSTVSDMLRYMDIYRSDGAVILSPQSINQMCTPYAQPVPGQFYGYGMMIHSNYRGCSIIEHGGNLKGVAAWASCVRERGLTGVALTNRSPAPSGDLLLGAINKVLGVPARTRRYSFKDYACPPARLAEYAGTYSSEEGFAVKISTLSTGLQFDMDGEKLMGRPVALDTFAVRRKGLESAARFIRNDKGECMGLAMGFRIVLKAAVPADERA